MPRAVRMTICSGCIEDFPHKEMYTVTRYMNRANPDPKNMYSTMYCKKCIKNDKEHYVEIKEKPKPPKKTKTTKKKNEKNSKKD
jgi:hypothetical protein